MRRPGCALVVFAVLALTAACSKQDQNEVSHDARNASQSVRQAVTNLGHDPAVKRALADARQRGHAAAVGVRHTASQADAAIHHLATSNERAPRDHTNRASDNSNS